MPKVKKTSLKQTSSVSKASAFVFLAAFAAIGIYLIFHAFAANPNLQGDVNGDNTVDSSDLTLLLANYGTAYPAADFNSNNTVDVSDFSVVLSHFGQKYTGGGTGTDGGDGSVPDHVETWVYDNSCNFTGGVCGGETASSALVRQWVDYAEGDSKALNDCHSGGGTCKVMLYFDTNIMYTCSGCSIPMASAASESWWLHQSGFSDSGHRVSFAQSSSNTGTYVNQSSTAVQSWLQSYVRQHDNSYDGLFMDDTAPQLDMEFYNASVTTSQEITTDAQLLAAHTAVAMALTHTDGTPFLQVNNGMPTNVFQSQLKALSLVGNPAQVIGDISEGQPLYDGSLTNYYPTQLDAMAKMANTANAVYVLMSYDPSGTVSSRRVQAATVLLGYAPGHIVSWSNLEYNSLNLAIWPEEGIYPTQAVETMAVPSGSGCLSGGNGNICTGGGHNDVQVATGVYRREFKQCYNQSVSFGACAVIVNTTGSAVTVSSSWLSQTYHHQITFNGGDVQSGGSLNLSGAAFAGGSTSVPSHDAAFLSP